MLKSMTGFGRAETSNEEFSCKVEARSVNNRFIDVHVKSPKYLAPLELPLKKLAKEKCARGSIDLHISLEKNSGENNRLEAVPDLEFASQYFRAISKIKESLNLTGQIDVNTILGIKEFIKFESPSLNEQYESLILSGTEKALESLVQMRVVEGETLQTDIESLINFIRKNADIIKVRQPQVLNEYQEKLKERIKVLSDGLELDDSRLLQETAILADRSDISEELTRLDSHLKQFLELTGNANSPIGRKLEFIVQEINRETNTIGSKSNDFEISQAVIEIKSALEKIREQLQNIE
jgi:uncharacterized protein (TIGR00255 family)